MASIPFILGIFSSIRTKSNFSLPNISTASSPSFAARGVGDAGKRGRFSHGSESEHGKITRGAPEESQPKRTGRASPKKTPATRDRDAPASSHPAPWCSSSPAVGEGERCARPCRGLWRVERSSSRTSAVCANSVQRTTFDFRKLFRRISSCHVMMMNRRHAVTRTCLSCGTTGRARHDRATVRHARRSRLSPRLPIRVRPPTPVRSSRGSIVPEALFGFSAIAI